MRVTSTSFTATFIQQISALQQQETQLQTEASTGLKISSPDSDPTAMTQVLELQNQATETQQYQSNISAVQSSATTAYSSIQNLQTLLNQASTYATTASSGTTSSTQMAGYASEVSGIIKQVLALANTQDQNGGYIFSGVASNTQPYTATTDSSGNYVSVAFNGSEQVNQVAIAPNLSVPSQIPGQNSSGVGAHGLFSDRATGSDVFSHLISLQNDILSGNQSAIASTDIPALQKDINNVTDQLATNGATQTLLNNTSNSLTSTSTNITTQMSNLTSADLPTTLTLLQQTQTAYQAALESGVKVFSVSLLDYLQ